MKLLIRFRCSIASHLRFLFHAQLSKRSKSILTPYSCVVLPTVDRKSYTRTQARVLLLPLISLRKEKRSICAIDKQSRAMLRGMCERSPGARLLSLGDGDRSCSLLFITTYRKLMKSMHTISSVDHRFGWTVRRNWDFSGKCVVPFSFTIHSSRCALVVVSLARWLTDSGSVNYFQICTTIMLLSDFIFCCLSVFAHDTNGRHKHIEWVGHARCTRHV